MKISVIIPVYNAARTINKTIGAILSLVEANPAVEIIAVDDGSIDATPEILKTFKQIKTIRQENSGPAAARNTGAKAAAGEILVFTDSDTIPEAKWLFQLTRPFENPEIMATTGTYSIANPNSPLAEIIQKEISNKHASYDEFIKFGGTYNLAIRRSLFQKIGGFNEGYRRASGEDNDLCYRILREGYLLKFVPQAIVAHYHPENPVKYMKEQFRHGFWRAKLYIDHPTRIAGDNYTGIRELIETSSSLFCLAALVFSIFKSARKNFLFKAASLLVLLLLTATEMVMALKITFKPGKSLFATAVFVARSFARTAGFLAGLQFFALKKTTGLKTLPNSEKEQ